MGGRKRGGGRAGCGGFWRTWELGAGAGAGADEGEGEGEGEGEEEFYRRKFEDQSALYCRLAA